MKTWVKAYTEILTDPKMGRLTREQKGYWLDLLCVAGHIDDRDENEQETGRLGTLEDIAWMLRCDVQELQAVIEVFQSEPYRMMHSVDGILYLTNYAKRQARRPSARPSAVRERVTRHRERKQDESCNADVTQVKRAPDKKRTDKREREKETERVTNAPDPPPPPEYDPKTPLHMQDDKTPVQIRAFREASGIVGPGPSTPAWDEIVNTVVDAPVDLKKWGDAVREWSLRGFKMTNVAGMLDWYQRGIPPRGSPREARAKMEAEREAAEDAERTRRRIAEWEVQHGIE